MQYAWFDNAPPRWFTRADLWFLLIIAIYLTVVAALFGVGREWSTRLMGAMGALDCLVSAIGVVGALALSPATPSEGSQNSGRFPTPHFEMFRCSPAAQYFAILTLLGIATLIFFGSIHLVGARL
jgi:hypothetical protein